METHDKRLAGQLYAVGRLNGILSRLEHVSKRGDGYRARCPAHGGKNTGTLSVSETDEGKILIKCWAGCSVHEVLSSLDLEMSDLFPERLTHHTKPEQIRKWKEDAIHRDWCDFTRDLMLEADVVYVAGLQIAKGEPLSQDDSERLKLALEQTLRIKGLFNG